MLPPRPVLIPIVLFALMLTACGRDEAPQQRAPAPNSEAPAAIVVWDEYVDEFIDAHFRFHPHEAVYAGLHQYDGQLPDLGPASIERLRAWLGEARGRLESWELAGLDSTRRFQRDYLLAAIDELTFFYNVSEFLYTNPVIYGRMIGPDVYLSREYAPLETRLRALIEYERNLPDFLATMRGNLRTPLARPYVEVAGGIFGGYVSFFESDVLQIFAGVGDAALAGEFTAANAGAVEAFRAARDWLDAQAETATDDYALGEQRFLEMLRMTEGLVIDLAELKAVGERDLQRNSAALAVACARYTPQAGIGECIARMQAEKPVDGPVAAARRQLPSLREFMVAQNLVTIPSDEVALVDEAPPYRRFNAAYIIVPGPYEHGLPSVYYIAPPDPSWSEADQLAYIPAEKDLLFTSVHEVWPGHFLQNLYSNQTRIGNLFGAYTFSEGWAHYTEEMMWEAGLNDGDPATHIGQLLNALLRNVRYLSAIGLHAEGMTVEQSMQLFRQKAHQDYGNSLQQARRGTYDPGYLNYTLGKLMIVKLRDDWTAGRGGRAAWREFHDRLLAYGEPPIPLVRRYMLGDHYAGDTRLLP